MKHIQEIILIVALLLGPLAATAQQFGDFTYTSDGSAITITKYTGPGGGHVAIPSVIDGLPVTRVEDWAFYGTNPTGVTIPNSITSIGSYAFYNCASLHRVTVPNNVTSIGNFAFHFCPALTNVAIGNGVTNLGTSAFGNCSSLTAITVNSLNPTYASVEGVVFTKSQPTLVQFPAGKSQSYAIPDGVVGIGDWPFAGSSLTNVTIPNSVVTIGQAFINCQSLISVAIPSSVTNIALEAFFGCWGLTAISVDALNSTYSSVAGVLFNKHQTKLIQYPPARAGSAYAIPATVTTIADRAFDSSSLTNVAIPGSVTNIGVGVFQNNGNLAHISIPDSVTAMGDDAFGNCSALASVTTGNGLTSIGHQAFSGCIGLETITIGTNIASIGDGAFGLCFNLVRVTIPANVAHIGEWAFADCQGLKGLYFQGNAPNVGLGAFSGHQNAAAYYLAGTTGWGPMLGELPAVLLDPLVPFTYTTNDGAITITGYIGPDGAATLPSTINGLPVTAIGSQAFGGDRSLISVTIPSSVTNIGWEAFFYCSSLTAINVDPLNPVYGSIAGVLFDQSLTTLIQCPGGKAGSYTIPTNATTIRYMAFIHCTRLTSVTIGSNITNIGGFAFFGCNSLSSITIPTSISAINAGTFYGCANLTSVTTHDGVTSIGEEAFRGCSSLSNITIPASVTNIAHFAFVQCASLQGVFFKGNTPSSDPYVFDYFSPTVYYLPDTTGWGATFAGRPTMLWNPLMQTSDPDFGVGPGGFGFNITGTAEIPVVVEASPDLAAGSWTALQSLTLTNGTVHFRDPNWTNYPARVYRIRSP